MHHLKQLVDNPLTYLDNIILNSDNSSNMLNKPSFDSLPLLKDGPPGNAWGLFGSTDQLGMLNLLTPENTAAAAKEIVDGVRVSTDWPLDSMRTPCFGRATFEHNVFTKSPRIVNDDTISLSKFLL